jgi:hypothetical protein
LWEEIGVRENRISSLSASVLCGVVYTYKEQERSQIGSVLVQLTIMLQSQKAGSWLVLSSDYSTGYSKRDDKKPSEIGA